MIFLAASIVSSTAIYVIFRWAKNYSCRLKPLITINYLVATLLGFGFLLQFNLQPFLHFTSWMPYAISLGVLYIIMFFLIGLSSQKAGITVTTLANKLSLVFPVFFSLFWFNETVTAWKYTGLITAILAVLLTLYKKNIRKTNLLWFVLPLVIFIGSGIIDSLVKLIQATQITDSQIATFSTFVFFVAFLCGVFVSFSKKETTTTLFHIPTLFLGILLGIANFGSLYFILNALNKSRLESSLVFALNNMLIVALSASIGFFIFKEKINRINVAGLILAFISLYILL
jgi:drug/metabolite transporter (DMT)-like permease